MSARLHALLALIATVVLGLGLTACGGDDDPTSSGPSADTSKPLRVGAGRGPDAEILRYVKQRLAPKVGLELEITTSADDTRPSVALQEGRLDATYVQTLPDLNAQKQDDPSLSDLVSLKPVHLEPLGVYSRRIEDIAAVPNGASVALSNDPADLARGLELLQQAGLITLKPDAPDDATPRDVAHNDKDLSFTTIAPASLPRSLDDTDLSVIGGSDAIAAKLAPAEDALVLEKAAGNPNATLLVVQRQDRTDPRVVQLEQLLHSPEVRTFIEDEDRGSVIPAF